MARRKREPLEEESQLSGGGGSSSASSNSLSTFSTSGGLKVSSIGNRGYSSNKPSPSVFASQQPAAAENSTTQYVGDGVQQSTQVEPATTQAQPDAKATSGNSAGHLSTIKTNYTKGAAAAGKASASAGYGNSHGKSMDNMRTTATKAAASGSYQNRDSSLSEEQREGKALEEAERGEKLSNTYNSDGERMSRDEFKAYQSDLKETDIQGMRRIVISPDPALSITEKEMISITRDVMWSWAETSGKQFDFSFAVHDGQSVIHSHVCMYSENANDINMASKQLETFKGLVDQAINDQLDTREELGQEIELEQTMDVNQKQGGEDDQQVNEDNSTGNSGDAENEETEALEVEAEEELLEMAL